RHPDAYLRAAGREEARASVRALDADDLAFEFMLNALRLRDGVPAALFTARTGLPLARVTPILAAARERGLLEPDEERLRASALGRRFLNDLVAMFLPDGARN